MNGNELYRNQCEVFRLMAAELQRAEPVMFRALSACHPGSPGSWSDHQVRQVLSALFDADPLLYDRVVGLARQHKDATGTVAWGAAR